jgi:hypothetical protein
MFICPAWSFDNVNGRFPIGFKIWNTEIKEEFEEKVSDICDEYGRFIGKKGFHSYNNSKYFSEWVNSFKIKSKNKSDIYLGWLARVTLNDFQSQNTLNILNRKDQLALVRGVEIYDNNLIESCICFAVRKVIPADWLNDRDQFLFPNDGWKTDEEFQSDCLTFTLFSNNIQSKYGTNHWIPFTETEVNAHDSFESTFMTDFIKEKNKINQTEKKFVYDVESKYVFSEVELPMAAESEIKYNVGIKKLSTKRAFSLEAQNVFKTGRELWRYYHKEPNCNVNASLYDIREHYQGRNDKGKMNNKSDNETYNELIGNLRVALKVLAKKIEPKVFEYGFLRR